MWYRYKPTTSGKLGLDADGSTFDVVIVVYRGSTLTSLTFVGYGAAGMTNANTNSNTVVPVVAGKSYYIQVGGVSGGSGTLHLRVVRVTQPANDLPGHAIAIGTLPYTHSEDTRGATASSEPSPWCWTPDHTVWFKYTPTSDGDVVLDLGRSDYRASVAVYKGSSLAPVGCDTLHFNVAQGHDLLPAVQRGVAVASFRLAQVHIEDGSQHEPVGSRAGLPSRSSPGGRRAARQAGSTRCRRT